MGHSSKEFMDRKHLMAPSRDLYAVLSPIRRRAALCNNDETVRHSRLVP